MAKEMVFGVMRDLDAEMAAYNVTQLELIEGWLAWAAKRTARQDIFMAGIGLLHESGACERYAAEGYAVLFRDAENEVDGLPTYRQDFPRSRY